MEELIDEMKKAIEHDPNRRYIVLTFRWKLKKKKK